MSSKKPPMPGCSALDSDGKICRKISVGFFEYHGNREIYGPVGFEDAPVWVVACLCKKHSQGMERFEEED